MTDISINSGKLLELIRYNNEASIRGLQDPHLVAFAKFIFCDFDIDSFKDLKKYYVNSSKIDIFSLYYCLSIFILEDKINSKEINFNDTFNKIIFTDKNIKKLLIDFVALNKKFSKKNLDTIYNNSINDDELKSLLISLAIKYSSLKPRDVIDFFPLINNTFILSNNIFKIRNKNSLNSAINTDGFLLLIFIHKFYSLFSESDLKLILDELVINGIFDGFLLNLYFLKNYQESNSENNFFNKYSNHLQYLPNRFLMSISQFFLLNHFFDNDYSSIKIWFNQFTDNINDKDINHDYDGFINWDIEDNNLEPVSYRSSQLNSRFYINSIHHLSAYRDKIKDLYNNDERMEKINVFGGSHAMSFANFNDNFFSTNVFFHYSDRFASSGLFNNFSSKVKFGLKNLTNKTIIIFDYEFFSEYKANDFLNNFFSIFSNTIDKDKIYFFTTPLPSLYSHRYLDFDDVKNSINNFNIELEKKVTEFGFKFIDTNLFLNMNSNYISSKDLLCHYFIKPDIIHKIIVEKVI
jgi:hypothetical protein